MQEHECGCICHTDPKMVHCDTLECSICCLPCQFCEKNIKIRKRIEHLETVHDKKLEDLMVFYLDSSL